jgi:hypothetical protein
MRSWNGVPLHVHIIHSSFHAGKKQTLVQSLCFNPFQKSFQLVFHVLKLRNLLVRRNVLITLMRGSDGRMNSLAFLPSAQNNKSNSPCQDPNVG